MAFKGNLPGLICSAISYCSFQTLYFNQTGLPSIGIIPNNLKPVLTVLEDKINWKSFFSLISRKDGWHITEGENYITEELEKQYHLTKDASGNFLLQPDKENDMIKICEKFLLDIYPRFSK